MSFESNKLVTLGQAVELSNEVLGKIAAKNYLTAVDSYTITKQTNPDTGYAATYQLFKGETAIGDKINIPKDMVVESGSVVNITYDTSGSTAALKEGDTDVTAAIIGVGNQVTSDDAGAYVKLVIANSDDTAIYIKATDLVDVYTNGNGITITNNAIAINIDSSNANGLSVGANGLALAAAGSAVTTYAQATGTYVEGTTYYTDSTGTTEVNTSGFENGTTDVSDYYVVASTTPATSGAMSAADKTKLDGFVVADSSDVVSAIAELISL